MPAAMLVIRLTASTSSPQWLAAMTSGTVLMPTASAPRARNARISAGGFVAGAHVTQVYALFAGSRPAGQHLKRQLARRGV